MIENPDVGRYGAVIEQSADGHVLVEYEGLESNDFVDRALSNQVRGYGVVPIGRLDPRRPDGPPHKVAWCRGYHGFDARDATIDEIHSMPANIVRRIALGGERGILNLGMRVPRGMVGEDRDTYGSKHGRATIGWYESRLERREPTYFVTARGFHSGSGIYLYRVPENWFGVGVLKNRFGQPGDVETIQPHLRYLAAPGSLHHIGREYQLYHEANGPKELGYVLPSRSDPDLASYPECWVEELASEVNKPNQTLELADILAAAHRWSFDDRPYLLDKRVLSVLETASCGGTRNATHKALWVAARQARAGFYPLSRAITAIESAAIGAYAQRGLGLDADDFARSVQHAIAGALGMSDAEVIAWGGRRAVDDREARK